MQAGAQHAHPMLLLLHHTSCLPCLAGSLTCPPPHPPGPPPAATIQRCPSGLPRTNASSCGRRRRWAEPLQQQCVALMRAAFQPRACADLNVFSWCFALVFLLLLNRRTN